MTDNESLSVYGVSLCPNCAKPIWAALNIVGVAIPPPVINVGCGCTQPPQQVTLNYQGSAKRKP